MILAGASKEKSQTVQEKDQIIIPRTLVGKKGNIILTESKKKRLDSPKMIRQFYFGGNHCMKKKFAQF